MFSNTFPDIKFSTVLVIFHNLDTLMKPHHLLTTTMPSRKNEKSSSRAKMSELSFYPVAIGNINGEKLDFYNNDNNCFVMDAKNTGNIGRYFNVSNEGYVITYILP